MAIAFIPARGGSKSIPLKNIKPLCGKPLVYWNLRALEDTPEVDMVYVATDSNEIESVVESFGFSKVRIYRRDDENAQDTSSTESVMIEFLDQEQIDDDETFMLVQATSPLTTTADFQGALRLFNEGACDSLLSCVRTKRFYWSESDGPINYDFNNRPRRQDFSGTLMENGALYVSKAGAIRKSKNRLSGVIKVYEMPEYTGFEIDEPDDWIVVEKLMYKYGVASSSPDIKLFLSDVDGTLTDAGMYYTEQGDEIKKFSTYDGKAFELLRNAGIKTGILTTEDTKMVENRARKLKVDYLKQGVAGADKLSAAKEICQKEGISLQNVAYIGDDVNCIELLSAVGLAGCPANSVRQVKQLPGIIQLSQRGGNGAVREFVDSIL